MSQNFPCDVLAGNNLCTIELFDKAFRIGEALEDVPKLDSDMRKEKRESRIMVLFRHEKASSLVHGGKKAYDKCPEFGRKPHCGLY